MTKRELEDLVKRLEARIAQLEARPVYVPYPVLQPNRTELVPSGPSVPYAPFVWCGNSTGGNYS